MILLAVILAYFIAAHFRREWYFVKTYMEITYVSEEIFDACDEGILEFDSRAVRMVTTAVAGLYRWVDNLTWLNSAMLEMLLKEPNYMEMKGVRRWNAALAELPETQRRLVENWNQNIKLAMLKHLMGASVLLWWLEPSLRLIGCWESFEKKFLPKLCERRIWDIIRITSESRL